MSRITHFNPTVPYLVELSEDKLEPGKEICINGVTSSFAQCFNINLLYGPNTVLQFAVNLLEKCIIITYKDGNWSEQHRCHSSIRHQKNFYITIACTSTRYEFIVDNERICGLPRSMLGNHITHLRIDGNISLSAVTYGVSDCSTVDEVDIPHSDLSENLTPEARSNITEPFLENGTPSLGHSSIVDGTQNTAFPSTSLLPPSYEDALKSISQQPIIGLIPYPTSYPRGMPVSPIELSTTNNYLVYGAPPSYEDTVRLSSYSTTPRVTPYPVTDPTGMPVPLLEDSP